jgi:hypothetical protein
VRNGGKIFVANGGFIRLDGVEARVNGMLNMYLQINALELTQLQKSGQRRSGIYRRQSVDRLGSPSSLQEL